MNELFAAFGIDWRLLLINLFNFGLLLGVLWYFLYTPLTQMLESRRERLAEGVRNADEAARTLAQVEESRLSLLAQAGKDADEVLARARAAAQEKQRDLISQGESSAAALLLEAQAQSTELKRKALEESKQEVAKLIVLGIERAVIQKSKV